MVRRTCDLLRLTPWWTFSNVISHRTLSPSVRLLMCWTQIGTPAESRNIFDDFLDKVSADFEINDACGCMLTSEPVTGKLLGREAELRLMISHLSASTKHRWPIIQTAAPPSSGKSALLQELARIFLDETEDRRGYGDMFCTDKVQ